MKRLAFRLLLSISASAAGLGAQNVLVVDANGGGAFTTIQAAIDATNPGDTVLVRPGSYTTATISTALTLIGDGPGVGLTGLTIANTPVTSTVVVRGIEVLNSASLILGDIVSIDTCAGEVWLQDCNVDTGQTIALAGTGIALRDSRSVTMIDCAVAVRSGVSQVIGIGAGNSALSMFGCTTNGGMSAAGLAVNDCQVYLQDTMVNGGEGASGFRGCAFDGAAGLVATGTSNVVALGSAFVGGPPGFEFPILCPMPMARPGPPTEVTAPATLSTITATPLTLRARGVAREMQAVDYVIDGDPGDALVLAFAVQPQAFFLPLIQSSLLVGTSFVGIPVGTLPASGTRTVPTAVPTYGPGIEVERYFVQIIALRSNGTLIGGSGQALTLLDAAF